VSSLVGFSEWTRFTGSDDNGGVTVRGGATGGIDDSIISVEDAGALLRRLDEGTTVLAVLAVVDGVEREATPEV